MAGFPVSRPRRLRQSAALRRLVAETRLHPADLVLPVFVREGIETRLADSLEQAHLWNEEAVHRNVGLVIETRPDHVDARELAWLRRLGVTKVQMGVQSLDDRILEVNKRGHTVAETHRAAALLRR